LFSFRLPRWSLRRLRLVRVAWRSLGLPCLPLPCLPLPCLPLPCLGLRGLSLFGLAGSVTTLCVTSLRVAAPLLLAALLSGAAANRTPHPVRARRVLAGGVLNADVGILRGRALVVLAGRVGAWFLRPRRRGRRLRLVLLLVAGVRGAG
jgi:hypothetical protein